MTVERREVRSYEKPDGKKAGELLVVFKLDDGSTQRATFPLRVDVKAGKFIAVDGDAQYAAPTRDELVEHMRSVAKAKVSARWRRYLEIEYSGGDGRVTLDWSIVEYTDAPVEIPGRSAGMHLGRKLTRDGEVIPGNTFACRGDAPDDLIPYTDERRLALVAITAALEELHKRLDKLVGGTQTSKKIARALDLLRWNDLPQLVDKVPTKAGE